ncbi:MAG: hypothetical protein ACYCR7_03350 [Thermoplasmataceae archaeon]
MMITAMMAIPIIQHFNNDYASVPVESYSYGNEMVKFIGQNAFVGFDGKMFPVSWTVFEQNPNYSPGPHVNPFAVSTNNTNTSAPLIEESFSNYSTNHIQSLWQNSAVMIKWNHYVRIAEIFSFTTKGIDASVVIKDLNVTGNYIGTFSMATGFNSTACTNGFNPSFLNLSSGLGAIPSNDWNITVGNLSLNWQSEDSIFSSGVISSGSSGDQIILPFNPGTINHNESYTIDPMIYYQPRMIIRGPIGGPTPLPPPPNPSYPVYLQESGLSSGTFWQATLNGQTLSSTSSEIVFWEHDGTYSYTIGSVSGYSGPSPSSGSVTVNGGSAHVGTSFNHLLSITFNEIGLSHGTTWSASLDGSHTESSSSSEIVFCVPNAIYSYNIGTVSGYATPSPSSGYVSTAGGSTQVGISFGHFPKLGYLKASCRKIDYISGEFHNFTQKIKRFDFCHFSSNYMVEGGYTTLNFSVPYYNATLGNSFWTNLEYGISACAVKGNGQFVAMNATHFIKGNGTWDFSWKPQPGVYKGFCLQFVNEYGKYPEFISDPFDVFSGLITNATTNESKSPCISDSASTPAVYESNGHIIGYLVITATGGPNGAWESGAFLYFSFELSFISPFNNVSSYNYKYGIFNYEQSVNYSGSQNGPHNNDTTFKPVHMNHQTHFTSSAGSATNAEAAIWNVAEAGLLFAAGLGNYELLAPGLAMAAIGPFLFSSSKTPGDSFYWGNQSAKENDFTFNNWINGPGDNMPPQTITRVACGPINPTGPDPICQPVYTIVNDGNGNASFMQTLRLGIDQASMDIGSTQCGLNYYTYSASATIVPIARDYWDGTAYVPVLQNDWVNATCVKTGNPYEPWTWGHYYEYSGPSYAAAASLPLYFDEEG